MTECHLLQDEGLPPEADPEQVEKVKMACKWDKITLGSSAQYHVNRWKIGLTGIRNAITSHIGKRRKIFKKPAQDTKGAIMDGHLQANITILDDMEVYVEMVLTTGVWVIVNAHEHTTARRLPQ